MWSLFAALFLFWCATDAVGAGERFHSVGILIQDGDVDTRERWAPTADYLTRRFFGHTFVVVPLRRDALNRAVASGSVEFVITDPGHFAELTVAEGMRGLATMQRRWRGALHSTAGAVIFAREDRSDIMWMSDLKGKSFMAVARDTFGDFQLAWWELRSHEIDPFVDFSRLIFSGDPPERVVEAVRDRLVDAAAVRTGVLERMAEEGAIDLAMFRVLHPRATTQHPVVRSTDLYPGWVFAATPASGELAPRVAEALHAMPVDGPAATAGRYAGWAAPLDYLPVHEVLRDLRLPPYSDVARMTLEEFVRGHGTLLAGAAALFMLLVVTTGHTSRLSLRLKASNSALERARQLEAQLAHAARLAAMGEMSSTLAHELNQPLAAIVNYAHGSVRRVRADGVSRDELIPILERIAAEATRSAEILARLRDFLRRRTPLHVPADINRIVRETAVLAEVEARRKAVSVRLDLATAPAPVLADPIQIQQVVLNLVHNAVEAIDDARSPRREVVIETRAPGANRVEVTVRDTGPGFAKEGSEHMFEPFVSTKSGGMGLGLSISRSIVEAHGGSLQARAGHDGGAAFWFSLPALYRTAIQ